MNEENEKTEVNIYYYTEENRWVDFLNDLSGYHKVLSSGRGGRLLRRQYTTWRNPDVVKCSKTELTGIVYYKHRVKGIIDRIEWEDGVTNKY